MIDGAGWTASLRRGRGDAGAKRNLAAALVAVLTACGANKDNPDYKQGYEIVAPGGALEWGWNGGVGPTSDDCLDVLQIVLTAMPEDAPHDQDAFLAGGEDYGKEAY